MERSSLLKISLLLTFLFGWNMIGLPPHLFQHKPGLSNPKTCCGRIVCQCRHKKNEKCPLRFAKQAAAEAAAPKKCHLQSPLPRQSGQQAVFKETAKKNLPLLKTAPCHKEKAELALPAYTKSFFPSSVRLYSSEPVSSPFYFPDHAPATISFSSPLERPPRLF